VKGLIEMNSFGTVEFAGDIEGDGNWDIFGPYTLDMKSKIIIMMQKLFLPFPVFLFVLFSLLRIFKEMEIGIFLVLIL
jgi:hypothetical protein